MAAGNFDAITNALKVAYPAKAIEPMVNADTPFRRKLNKSVPAGGRVGEGIVKFGGNISPPQNLGNVGENVDLPSPKDRTDVQFQLTPITFTGSMGLGWITRAAFNSGKAAFNGGELRRRTEEAISDLSKYIESSYVGTTGSGWRCKVESTASNSTTFTAKQPEGVRLLRENMKISGRINNGATVSAGAQPLEFFTITALNQDTRLVTHDGGATIDYTADDTVHPVAYTGQVTTSSTDGYPYSNGLRGLVDDGTYLGTIHGLSRTTYPKLKSIVSSNGGSLRDLTEQILIRACHESRNRTGKRVTDAWAGPGVVEKYIQFVAPDRRYTVSGNSTQGKATGYEESQLSHVHSGGGFMINLSFDCIAREMFLLNWDTFFHYVAQEIDWVDDGGMLKLVPGTGGYKSGFLAYLASIENIGCDMPLANTVIRDLRDPSIGDA